MFKTPLNYCRTNHLLFLHDEWLRVEVLAQQPAGSQGHSSSHLQAHIQSASQSVSRQNHYLELLGNSCAVYALAQAIIAIAIIAILIELTGQFSSGTEKRAPTARL